ncbi:MAG: DUF4838 domain-containing protein [Lentisphaeria bacterium]|nr:DUF4838 domain-containing protein [Lentisphaeria bacterium]
MKHQLSRFLTSFAVVSLALAAEAEPKLKISQDGKSDYCIRFDKEDKDPRFVAAIKDLGDFLHDITGATIPLDNETATHKIIVGYRAPGDDKPFSGIRERRIKSVGEDIYIYGDGRFGTIGAIYDFLEKFCGCRWFGPWNGDTFVPKDANLILDPIDYSHAPSFYSLELGSAWALAKVHPGITDYLRRNRCFLQPDYRGPNPALDGWKYIGPTTHGLSAYFPPGGHKPGSFEGQWAGPHVALADKAYFKDHPEYFTMDKNGKRVPNRQPCFSNQDVRRILTENIETVLKYEKYNLDEYAILDISFNDRSGGFCECPECKALEDKYQSPGGPYYDYLIELGNNFINKYPKLVIRMIAYQPSMTGVPPKEGIKFPANISVIVAPLIQDFSKPLSNPYNTSFRKEFAEWGRIADNMWWWSYPVLYPHGIRAYALFPGVYRNAENIKYAYNVGTRYIISEMGGSLIHNCAFKKLNDYLEVRLADNVNDSVDRIVKEYCDHCYGPASDLMIKYLRETNDESIKDPNYFIYYDDPRSMRSLHSPANLIRWQGYFNEMAKLIGDDKYRQLQLGRARINLDVLTLLQWNRIREERPEYATFENLEATNKRYVAEVEADSEDVWGSQFHDKYAQGWEKRLFMGTGITAFYGERKVAPIPEELVKKYGQENVTPIRLDARTGAPKRTDEQDAASGTAVEVQIVDAQFGYMPCVMERTADGSFKRNIPSFIPFKSSPLIKTNLPVFKAANGYKPYFIDTMTLGAAHTVVVSGIDTKVQFYIAAAFDPDHPDQKYDLYISIKFLEEDRVLIDRMYVCKVMKDNIDGK